MMTALALAAALSASPASPAAPAAPAAPAKEVPPMLSTLTMKSLAGDPVSFSRYQGKVLLVANVASECGFTPQYADLQKVHETYKDRGLAVLGIPSNEFGGQEPGSSADIASFCRKNYGVSFDMFEKVSVKGESKVPLYAWLTTAADKDPGEVKWNFEKFLVGKDGKVIARFRSKVKPTDAEVTQAIEAALAAK